MTVRALLEIKPTGPARLVCIAADAPVREAVERLARHRIGALPVTDGGELVGILSERDIVRALVHAPSVITLRVGALMTARPFVCRLDDSLETVLRVMNEKRIRHLPVVDAQGGVIGMVTLGDIAGAWLENGVPALAVSAGGGRPSGR